MIRLGRTAGKCVWFAWEVKPVEPIEVGAFWDKRKANYLHAGLGHVVEDLHVWICIVPCLPFHFVMPWRIK